MLLYRCIQCWNFSTNSDHYDSLTATMVERFMYKKASFRLERRSIWAECHQTSHPWNSDALSLLCYNCRWNCNWALIQPLRGAPSPLNTILSGMHHGLGTQGKECQPNGCKHLLFCVDLSAQQSGKHWPGVRIAVF